MRWLLGMFLLTMPALTGAAVTFSTALYEKFQHPRCVQCHQFNSRHGRAFTSHLSRYLCDNCHTPRLTGLVRGAWMAPAERLDFTGLGPVETCEFIKRSLGPEGARERLAGHLLHDSRVLWALESGMTPAGRFPTVPGGREAWARDVRAWIEGGLRCE